MYDRHRRVKPGVPGEAAGEFVTIPFTATTAETTLKRSRPLRRLSTWYVIAIWPLRMG
jgi:hypothetical protein